MITPIKILSVLFFLFPAADFCLSQGTVNLPLSLAGRDAGVEEVHTGLVYSEGPAVDDDGTVYFSEIKARKVWKVPVTGDPVEFAEDVTTPNGHEFDSDGYLIGCQRERVVRYDSHGAVRDILTESSDYGSINDLSIGENGGMFFTNNNDAFWYRSPGGKITKYSSQPSPNGIEWIGELGFVYVNMVGENKVVTFEVDDTGEVNLDSRRVFADVPVPDGLTVDADYNVYIASYADGRVYVFDSAGTALGDITLNGDAEAQGNTSNCTFGGPENKTLYITGDGGLYKVTLEVPGRKQPGSTAVPIRPLPFGSNKQTIPGLTVKLPAFNSGGHLLEIVLHGQHNIGVTLSITNLQNTQLWSGSFPPGRNRMLWNSKNKPDYIQPGFYLVSAFSKGVLLDSKKIIISR